MSRTLWLINYWLYIVSHFGIDLTKNHLLYKNNNNPSPQKHPKVEKTTKTNNSILQNLTILCVF